MAVRVEEVRQGGRRTVIQTEAGSRIVLGLAHQVDRAENRNIPQLLLKRRVEAVVRSFAEIDRTGLEEVESRIRQLRRLVVRIHLLLRV